MVAVDPYVHLLAEEIGAQLTTAGCTVKVEPRYHNMAVHIQRDDREHHGLWVSTCGYGSQKKGIAGGLWPYFRGKEEHPTAQPTVQVSYGREVRAAARDVLRRLMPAYLEAYARSLSSIINYRDRDNDRDRFLANLKAIPGVRLRLRGDDRAFEVVLPGDGNVSRRFLSGTMWSNGEVYLERGTLTEDQFTGICRVLASNQVSEPVAVYRQQRRQYRDTLLFVRDVDSYVTLYRDAEQVAALLDKPYDGVSPLRVAPPLFDDLAFRLVRGGSRVAVLFDPEALDPNAARQVDLYDLLQNQQPNNDVEERTEGPEIGSAPAVPGDREVPRQRAQDRISTDSVQAAQQGGQVHPPGRGTRKRLAMPNKLVEAPTPRDTANGYTFMSRGPFSQFKERKDLKLVSVRCDRSRDHCLRALRDLPSVAGWNVFNLHANKELILQCELELGTFPSGHPRGGGKMLQVHHEKDVDLLRKKCIATMRAWVVRNIPK